jgi:glycerate dehydrogenase
MKIAYLNYSYLTDGHLEKLGKIGELIQKPDVTDPQVALQLLDGVEIAILDSFELPLDRKFFEQANSLKYVCLNTTGFNLVDTQAAKEKGILISNLPGFSTEAVAEHAIGLMFAVSRHIQMGDRDMHKNPFQINPAKRADDKYIGNNISGKTLGIIGLGKIGSRIAELGNALGMEVIGYNRTTKSLPGVRMVDIETLYKESDIIMAATAYSIDQKGLIDSRAFSLMKMGVIIINVARGELIDEPALVEALKQGKVAGVGADVVSDWSDKNPLLKFENVILTPHMAFMTRESLQNMGDIIVSNIESYVAGRPQNLVN